MTVEVKLAGRSRGREEQPNLPLEEHLTSDSKVTFLFKKKSIFNIFVLIKIL